MGINKIPPGDAPYDERVHPDRVWYHLWYCSKYPLSALQGKLDKDPLGTQPWIMGLLAAIKQDGHLKNPVIVWNHHPMRGGKQPTWLLRAGSNRVWCAEQLDWSHVPAIVSTVPGETPPCNAVRITPDEIQEFFVDGGNIWANEHGFGLLRAKKPELTYADYVPTPEELALLQATDHDRRKIVNPMMSGE